MRINVDDQYAVHHEFSNATTKEDIESVESIKKYIASHQDPFGDIQKMRSLIPSFDTEPPLSSPPPNVSFKKPQWNLYKVETIGAWQKCPLYGDVLFIERERVHLIPT